MTSPTRESASSASSEALGSSASSAAYTPYHPRWLRRRVSTYWWLHRRSYFAFILRELSSIFIAWFVVFLLMFVRAVSRGDSGYRQFLDWAGGPLVVLLNAVSLFFVVFHALTWFTLAPKAIVVNVAGKPLPAAVIAGSNYLAWIVVSALVAWTLMSGR
jgi:fumarate reductase subunit C